ncbi:hypothetical protein [Mycolicibacterium sp. XJ870]
MDLAAAVDPIGDPISAWVTTLTNAAQNLGALGGQVVDNGAPILTQFLANQVGYANLIGAGFEGFRTQFENYLNSTLPFYFQYASDFLKAGQIGEAFSWGVVHPVTAAIMTMTPLINNLKIPGMIAQNVANVLQAIPAAIQPIGFGAITTLTNPFHTFGAQLQSITDAVNAGDPLSAVNAMLNIPAAMSDSLLTGLLKPYQNFFDAGLVAALVVDLPRTIAAAITPPASLVAPAAVESAPDTLAADALPAAETPAVDASVATPDALPATTDQTPGPARLADELTSGVTNTVNSLTSAASSAINAVKTVTLKVDPKPAATETSTTGGSSADANAPDESADASNAKADKESKKQARKEAREAKRQERQEARVERQQARQEAKDSTSTGGKHRADKNNTE